MNIRLYHIANNITLNIFFNTIYILALKGTTNS
jgi:hypothetical protein